VDIAVRGDKFLSDKVDKPTISIPLIHGDLILLAYRGSIAHNMYVPPGQPGATDDIDLAALNVPPIDYYFGTANVFSKGTEEIKDGATDLVVYELRKAINLLAKGNPNMLSLLWLKEQHYIKVTTTGRKLLANRKLFVGKSAYFQFAGYAASQLCKMTTRQDYGGYQGDKRRQQYQQFGYDCKMAAHLIRLLKMGVEFLQTGNMQVYRQDADMLLQIKQGQWSVDKVTDLANSLFADLKDARASSTLPESPDTEAINRLSIDLIEEHFYGHR
jgi:predicted nucleotidyltransferase